MQYRLNWKNGDRISALGFGGLRLPKTDDGKINHAAVKELVKKAFELGITHYDTAYSYEGSEEAIGNAVCELDIRQNVTLSTKLPIVYCNSVADFDKYLERSLQRLKTDYVDYYFLHALNRKGRYDELVELGILEWIIKAKDKGIIKNIGFSSHASFKEFSRIISAYEWDFAMVQYNYIDEYWQAGIRGLKLADECRIPMFIMEPLRGGMLADNLPNKAKELFDNFNQEYTYAGRALRYVLNRSDVITVLSGMNEITQIIDNCKTTDSTLPNSLKDDELEVYKSAAKEIHKVMEVYCTSCGYCMPCPKGVNIPACMNRLNSSNLIGIEKAKKDFEYHDSNGRILNCIGCGLCKSKCPQGIDIPEKIQIIKKKFHL